jgi:hypothetical protein
MSALISGLTGFIDSVLGLNVRPPGESSGEVPCNMFSGYMLFGCRHGR